MPRNFLSSFVCLTPFVSFVSFSRFACLTKASGTMLNKNSEKVHPLFVSNFRRKITQSFTVTYRVEHRVNFCLCVDVLYQT